ncbi:MAG: hypothetical protein AB1758_08680, partial [Candidatus Eremiobacterota bacterium]
EAAQEAAIQQAISSGQPVSFQNSQGLTVTLTVTLVNGVYEVTDPSGDVMSVQWDGAPTDPVGVVARATDYWTQIPQSLQEPRLTVIVKTGDTDKEDDLHARADETTMTITFYNSKNPDTGQYYTAEDNVNERAFTHEFAHIIGPRLDRGPDILNTTGFEVPADFSFTYPHGDPRHSPTSYGDDQWHQDGIFYIRLSIEAFAEHWTLYNEAVDQGPAAMDAYRAAYPNESAWFDRHFPQAAAQRDAVYPPGP